MEDGAQRYPSESGSLDLRSEKESLKRCRLRPDLQPRAKIIGSTDLPKFADFGSFSETIKEFPSRNFGEGLRVCQALRSLNGI